jgi:hypothetical protein
VGCYTFFDTCANAIIDDSMDAMAGEPLTTSQKQAVARIRPEKFTHAATEEATCTGLGYLHIAEGGQAITDTDRVLRKLAHERFCKPRFAAVSGTLDVLRHAFTERHSTSAYMLPSRPPLATLLPRSYRTDPPA